MVARLPAGYIPVMDVQKLEGLFVAFVGGGAWLLLSFGKLPLPAYLKSGWGKKMLPWIGPLMILFGIFIMFEPKPAEEVDLDALASSVKAKLALPVAVDQDTRLDDVKPIAGALGYFLTITNVQAADPDLAQKLESQLRETACSTSQYKQLFDAGISIHVVYRTNSGDTLASILIKPTECKK